MICPAIITEAYGRAKWTIDSAEQTPLQNLIVIEASQRPPVSSGHRIRRDRWAYLGEWQLLGKDRI